jgi:hypothetical protein
VTLGHLGFGRAHTSEDDAIAQVREDDMSEIFDDIVEIQSGSITTVLLNAQGGNITLGGGTKDGDLTCLDSSGATTVRINGEQGNLRLGGGTKDGDLTCLDSSGATTVRIDGEQGNLRLGGGTKDGDLTCRNSTGVTTVHINGEHGNLVMGGNGQDGDIALFPGSATDTGDWAQATIRLDADTGDIRLSGADCAERFDVAGEARIEPGEVLIVSESERLEPCSTAYDKRVLGVVSGAGGYRPGLILDSSRETGRAPVALMGKVYCKVDASEHPIGIGDMLTTSDRSGFAMKAADPARAFGAVLGKALRGLASGQGMIPVLVALQ